ncbi:hypothetical protein F511_44693 [Dorcoceras hygrometricum]|uniref:Uncharacterized protein n=1 Tax=Dorcoceras hygrometricum TaxID=472368 RepID=A0A2Z7AXM7_9LAMI|nr:hypothetical protein F511_44693 [Dorcoceras hygrometricum]
MSGNDGNSPEKLTVNSTRGFERRMKVGRIIANSQQRNDVALHTSENLIEALRYNKSLQSQYDIVQHHRRSLKTKR